MATENLNQKFTIIVEKLEKLIKLSNAYKGMGNTIKNLNTKIKTLNTAFVPLASKFDKLEKSLTRASNRSRKLSKDLSLTDSRMRRLGSTTRRTTASFSKLGIVQGVIIGSLVSRGVATLTNAFRDSISTASIFLERIAEIQTISQNAQLSTEAWAESLATLSARFNIPLLDVAEGAYKALSNQIAEGAETFNFLQEAARLSVVTVASLEEAVTALTGILNSYGLSAAHARDVSNSLFKAQELGNFRLRDIASSIGSVTIFAKQLGVTYDEVFASLDSLTIQGVDAARAMTFLRGVFLKTARPTDVMKGIFADLGVTSGRAAIDLLTFTGFLEHLRVKAIESGDAMTFLGEAFGRLRPLQGALGLTFNPIDDTLKEIQEAGSDTDTAFRIIMEGLGRRFNAELNKISLFFTTKFGPTLVKGIVEIGDKFGGFANVVTRLVTVMTQLAFSVAAVKIISLADGFIVASSNAIGFRATIAALNTQLLRVGLSLKLIGAAAVFFLGIVLLQEFARVQRGINIFAEEWTSKFAEESAKRNVINDEAMDNLVVGTVVALEEIIEAYRNLTNEIAALFTKLQNLGKVQGDLQKSFFESALKRATGEGNFSEARRLATARLAIVKKEFFDQIEILSKKNPIDITKDERENVIELRKELGSIEDKRNQAEASLRREKEKTNKVRKRSIGLEQQLDKQDRFHERILTDINGRKRIEIRGRPSQRRRSFVGPDNNILKLGRNLVLTEQQTKRINKSYSRAGTSSVKSFNTAASTEVSKKADEALEKLFFGSGDKTAASTPEAIEKARLAIEDRNKAMKRAIDLQTKHNDTTKKQKEVSKVFTDTIHELRGSFEGLNEELTTGLLNLKSFVGPETSATIFDTEATVKARQFFVDLEIARKDLKVADTEEELTALVGTFFNLGTELNSIRGLFLGLNDLVIPVDRLIPPQAVDQIADLNAKIVLSIKALIEANELKAELSDIDAEVKDLESALGQMNAMSEAIQDVNIAANTTIEGLVSSFNAATAQFIAALDRLSNALSRSGPAPLINLHGGTHGASVKAHGGSIGKDSQNVLMDPREFIMNAKQTSRFLPQLIAMNSGKRFDAGGVVTNNIGDINVNVTAAEGEKINARVLANQLRRELRRNTVRLN